MKVSTYFKNKTAKNMKNNLRNLANNIQIYYKDQNEKLNADNKQELCDLYEQNLCIYIENPNGQIPDDLLQRYKEIVSKYRHTNK